MTLQSHLLSCAQRAKIFCRLGHGIIEELEGDAPSFRPLFQAAFGASNVGNLDVEKDPRVLRVGPSHFFLPGAVNG